MSKNANPVPLELECENHTSSDRVEWQKEGVSIEEVLKNQKEGENSVVYDSNTGRLTIVKDKPEVYGNYTCNSTANGNISSLFRIVRKY